MIIGAGGHGREALMVARASVRAGSADWRILGFLDDGEVDREALDRLDARHLGEVESVGDRGAHHVIAIGAGHVRREMDARIRESSPAAVLVDPTALVGDDVELAPGVMLYPGSRCTTNVRIGRHSHVNCGATISHDCRVGEYVSVSPGALLNGGVTVEDGALIGSGAVVLPGRRIGENALVRAGSVVTADVDPG